MKTKERQTGNNSLQILWQFLHDCHIPHVPEKSSVFVVRAIF